MLHVNRLRIWEGLAVHHEVATQLANEDRRLMIRSDVLLRLLTARTRVHDEGAIESARYLAQVVVVAVIPVCASVGIYDGEIIGVALAWRDGILAYAWHAVSL